MGFGGFYGLEIGSGRGWGCAKEMGFHNYKDNACLELWKWVFVEGLSLLYSCKIAHVGQYMKIMRRLSSKLYHLL